jgi:hypothetical protein
MTKLLLTIDRRVRFLDRAFPKSAAKLLDEEIECELARFPDGGKAFTREFVAEAFPNSTLEETARGDFWTIPESDYKAFMGSQGTQEVSK